MAFRFNPCQPCCENTCADLLTSLNSSYAITLGGFPILGCDLGVEALYCAEVLEDIDFNGTFVIDLAPYDPRSNFRIGRITTAVPVSSSNKNCADFCNIYYPMFACAAVFLTLQIICEGAPGESGVILDWQISGGAQAYVKGLAGCDPVVDLSNLAGPYSSESIRFGFQTIGSPNSNEPPAILPAEDALPIAFGAVTRGCQGPFATTYYSVDPSVLSASIQ